MPNDIPDWTQATDVQAGTVAISNSPSVTVTGTVTVSVSNSPSVSIAGTPTVIISSGTVSIGNTPTVILGAGVASVGSISAISSTVTVAGTINIGNTPAVTISGTPTVNISSGTVSITGTPDINILSQSVQVAVNQPQTTLGSVSYINGSASGTFNLPTGCHAVGVIQGGSPGGGSTGVFVRGAQSGVPYLQAAGGIANQAFLVVPIASATDTQVTLQLNGTGGVGTVTLIAILDVEAIKMLSLYGDLQAYGGGGSNLASLLGAMYIADAGTTGGTGALTPGRGWRIDENNAGRTQHINPATLVRQMCDPPASTINLSQGTGIATGATLTLVSAVANAYVYLGTVHWNLDAAIAASVASWRDVTAGVDLGTFSTAQPVGGSYDFKGFRMTQSNGFGVKNYSGSTLVLRGTLAYTQSAIW